MLSHGYQPPGATEDQTDSYFYFRSPSDANASLINTATFRPGATLPKPNRGPGKDVPAKTDDTFLEQIGSDLRAVSWWVSQDPVPVAAWDWNRPLACLIELQRLGFTASDLMLTPEETAALAAADPAVVGFKF